ncbi:bidirectional sugar transporter SWEET4-like protein [Carex littledalei]|uniref:Bidirectional sugar transporter SWEET4-like protein n=1 Tax=Carex littledalei TaxID=544730 RepID=A0A833R3M1_9POAL|nr:bidirectional sugar transporter SWEET4-like protein [Carex littledalei]
MWVLYGLPIVHPHSILVITINGAGMLIEISYILLFILYSQGRTRLQVLLMFVASIISVAVIASLVIMLAHTHERRSMIVGIICVVLCIIMYAAPLFVMKMVIQTRSVEYMPLFLSLASFFNGVCWTAYALIRFDPYIIIPNGLGVALASAQLLLYAIYYKSTQRQIEARRNKEEMGLAEVVVIRDSANKVGAMEVSNGR